MPELLDFNYLFPSLAAPKSPELILTWPSPASFQAHLAAVMMFFRDRVHDPGAITRLCGETVSPLTLEP